MARRTYPLERGELDRYITIEQRTETIGTSGFPDYTWSELAKVYASRTDLSGAERFQADQLSTRFDTRWETGYRSDLDPDEVDVPKTLRIVYKLRNYDIVSASVIGRREGIEMLTLASTA